MTRNRIKSAPRSGGRAPRESTRAAHQGLLVASLVAGFGCAGGTSGEMESATAGTTGGETESATAAETETGSSGMNTDDPDPSRPFEPITPAAALHKVKTFLVGIANRAWPYGLFVVVLLGISLFIERPYCKYLCPLGAAPNEIPLAVS